MLEFFLIKKEAKENSHDYNFRNYKNKRRLSQDTNKIKKIRKIKGITVEQKSHRIKNNLTKLHYNYNVSDIDTHLEEFAFAILNHQIPDYLINCKTFKILLEENIIKIFPGSSFKFNKKLN